MFQELIILDRVSFISRLLWIELTNPLISNVWPSIRIIIQAIRTCLLFYHCPLPGQGLGPLNETNADDEASYGYNETTWTCPVRSMLILIPDGMVLCMLLARAWLSSRQPKQVTSSQRLRHWNPQRSLFQEVSSFTIDTGRGKGEQREKDNIFLGYGDYSSRYIYIDCR